MAAWLVPVSSLFQVVHDLHVSSTEVSRLCQDHRRREGHRQAPHHRQQQQRQEALHVNDENVLRLPLDDPT